MPAGDREDDDGDRYTDRKRAQHPVALRVPRRRTESWSALRTRG
jgi:hypothetical protein